MAGTLYIVATPIGNLEDITQRALRVLREVDLVACEDTRHTQRLLNHFAIKTKTVSYHEHNERERTAELCRLLESGKNIALVSDAGMPLVSDPGFRIVDAAIEREFSVVAIPGAAAFVTALVASGMPGDQFLFAGFLPSRANARRAKLESLREIPATLIFYEAPHRLAAALKDAVAVLGNRPAVVGRELTKLHEEIVRGSLTDLTERFAEPESVRGEIVLLIGAEAIASSTTVSGEVSPQRLSERVSELEKEGVNAKDALKRAAREMGIKRAEAYRMMVSRKNR
ncbi:MAG TPA: 16S rRNA (cytidine(1402)-2'-O)-methyltransferase [Pyrinomonadaceae bacterium]